jgi:hypothetical protein
LNRRQNLAVLRAKLARELVSYANGDLADGALYRCEQALDLSANKFQVADSSCPFKAEHANLDGLHECQVTLSLRTLPQEVRYWLARDIKIGNPNTRIQHLDAGFIYPRCSHYIHKKGAFGGCV